MAEYKLKLKVYTGNIIPPWWFESFEVYEASSAQEAIKKAKNQYFLEAPFDTEEYPLVVEDVEKL